VMLTEEYLYKVRTKATEEENGNWMEFFYLFFFFW
jgi:hypothetical protein